MKPISVIVPALNEENYLPKLLRSIVGQKYDGEYEVIVVDGKSQDKTVAVAEAFGQDIDQLRVISCERGISRQRNYGAKHAKYENFVFIDADTVLTPGSLEKLVRHFSRHKKFVGLPFIVPDYYRWYDMFWFLLCYGIVIVTYFWRPVTCGMCLLATRDVHEKIGGFNEAMTHAEDAEYGLRAHRAGANYHVFWDTKIYGSARRIMRDGRLKIAKAWLGWYIQLVRKGPDGVKEKNYEFGDFKAEKDGTK